MFGCGVPSDRAVVLSTPPGVALRISVVLARPTSLGLTAFLVAACTQALLVGVGRFYEVHVIHVVTQCGVLQPDWPLVHGVHVRGPPQVANTLNLEAMGVFEIFRPWPCVGA